MIFPRAKFLAVHRSLGVCWRTATSEMGVAVFRAVPPRARARSSTASKDQNDTCLRATSCAGAKLALELEETIAARAKGNLSAAGASAAPGKPCQKSDNLITPVDTKRELATIAGVSHDTVAKEHPEHCEAVAAILSGGKRVTNG